MSENIDLSFLAEGWPSEIVWREKVGQFSGGVLDPKTMANLDSCGKGPAGRFRIGRKVVYTVEALIRWIEDRAEVVK